MGITLFGLIILPLSLLNFTNPMRLIQFGLVTGVFEAAAAIILGPLGIQPGFVSSIVFLAYVCGQYALGMRYPGERVVLWATTPLIALLCYALISALTLPNVFAGVVMVWPQKNDFPDAVPLSSSMGNVTQSLYLILNVMIVIFGALFMTRRNTNFIILLKAYLAGGYLVIGLALWQLANRLAGVPFPSDLLYSNPGWTIVEQSVGSIPRLQGPFTEPSALAQYLCGVVYCTLWLSISGHNIMRPRLLFALSASVVLLSTSTTGIVFIFVCVPVLFVYCLKMSGRQKAVRQAMATLLLSAGGVLFACIIAVLINPDIVGAASVVLEATLDKKESASYLERTAINDDAIKAFFETYGLGVGWGSFRAMQFVPGVLANGGVFCLVMVFWFAVRITILARQKEVASISGAHVAVGAFGAALVAQFITLVISGAMITSTHFYLQLACIIGAAASCHVQAAARSRIRRSRPLAASI